MSTVQDERRSRWDSTSRRWFEEVKDPFSERWFAERDEDVRDYFDARTNRWVHQKYSARDGCWHEIDDDDDGEPGGDEMLMPVEHERLCFSLPRHAHDVIEDLRQRYGDDPRIDLLPLDTASRGREMLKIQQRQETWKRDQQRWFDKQVKMAKRGYVFRFGEWVRWDWQVPAGGLPNRFRRR